MDKTAQQSTATTGKTTSLTLILAVVLWLGLSVSALAYLASYSVTAGKQAAAPALWPAASKLALNSPYTLLLFVHPKCPCTRATMTELSKIMTRSRQLKTLVIFIQPEGCGEDWSKTDLYQRASAISGVTCIIDKGAVQSQLFGAYTSGQVMLFDAGGHLLFQGGITTSRGHEGDNIGADTIVGITRGKPPSVTATEVFGCPMQNCREADIVKP